MVETLDVKSAALHELVAEDLQIDRVAGGFAFTEGPVWRGDELLFSDIRNNRIVRLRQLKEGPEVTTFSLGRSNGLTIDHQSEVLAAEHGGRRVSRIGDDGQRVTVVDRYQGRLFWPAPFRDAVLARLLRLNEDRARMERML